MEGSEDCWEVRRLWRGQKIVGGQKIVERVRRLRGQKIVGGSEDCGGGAWERQQYTVISTSWEAKNSQGCH